MAIKNPASNVVVLGNFDGVHKGHQALLKKARELVGGQGFVTVRTFENLHKERITPNSLRASLLYRYGADEIISDRFEDIRGFTPNEFVGKYLLGKYKYAVCGFNYFFGANRSGNAETLKELFGDGVCVVEETTLEGETVSSTVIRELLKSGQTEKAVRMLGHPYIIEGEVLHGKSLGHTIGFPTLNMKIEGVIPLCASYYGFTEIDGVKYPTMTGVTKCPTVNEEEAHAETYIIGYSGDLYEKTVSVNINGLIRKEQKFSSVEELINQLKKDEITASEKFKD